MWCFLFVFGFVYVVWYGMVWYGMVWYGMTACARVGVIVTIEVYSSVRAKKKDMVEGYKQLDNVKIDNIREAKYCRI